MNARELTRDGLVRALSAAVAASPRVAAAARARAEDARARDHRETTDTPRRDGED